EPVGRGQAAAFRGGNLMAVSRSFAVVAGLGLGVLAGFAGGFSVDSEGPVVMNPGAPGGKGGSAGQGGVAGAGGQPTDGPMGSGGGTDAPITGGGGGACQGGGGTKAIGAACGCDGECGSGFCADGVCCNTRCSGACVSCAVPGDMGECTVVDQGMPDPHGFCKKSDPKTC